MGRLVEIGMLQDWPPGAARFLPTSRGGVAVFRLDDTRLAAVANRCPHQAGSLAHGWVEGTCVVCPDHHWAFSVETGACVGQEEEVRVYRVEVDGEGRVRVELPQGEEAIGSPQDPGDMPPGWLLGPNASPEDPEPWE